MLGEGLTCVSSLKSGGQIQEASALPTEAGVVVMDGTWCFRWLDDVNYELSFQPDDISNLPHWPAAAGLAMVAFENAHEILGAVMTRKARLGLRWRLQLQVFGRAKVTADSFAMDADLDGNPFCWMRCLAFEAPQKAQPLAAEPIAERTRELFNPLP